MKYIFKSIFIIFSFLFLSSCSTYKIAHDFTPPKTKVGLQCLNRCQVQLKQCNLSCSQNYKKCGIKAAQTAKIQMPGLLAAYPHQLEQWLNAREEYRRELDWYEFRRDIEESRYERHLARCKKAGKKYSVCANRFSGHSVDFDRPSFNLPKPIKPALASTTNRIRKETCNASCGCNQSYRSCYTSCGGIVKSKKVCVKNCR